MAILDWQYSRYCSPAIDVLHHIFGVTSKAYRDQHYETLLRTYHNALSETIKRLGSDPETLFTFDDLQSELKKFGDFPLALTPLIAHARITKEEDVKGLDSVADAVNSGAETCRESGFDAEQQREFDDLIDGLVIDLVEYGYVQLEKN